MKLSFCISEGGPNFLHLGVLKRKFSENCFMNKPTFSHLHPLQVGNCDSNSRLVVNEDDNSKFRLGRVNYIIYLCYRKPYFSVIRWISVHFFVESTQYFELLSRSVFTHTNICSNYFFTFIFATTT